MWNREIRICSGPRSHKYRNNRLVERRGVGGERRGEGNRERNQIKKDEKRGGKKEMQRKGKSGDVVSTKRRCREENVRR